MKEGLVVPIKKIFSVSSIKRTLECVGLTVALSMPIAAEVSADFKVVGYFPTWQGSVNEIGYDKITHLNYSFLIPQANGGLNPLEGGGQRLQDVVAQAHSEGVKVLIAVGGWNGGDDSAFRELASSSASRSAFVTNIVNFINQYNLDGVDIDWEYPDAGSEADNYKILMQQLSSELHNRGKLLTAAVTSNDFPGSVDASVIGSVDFLNIMAYDMGYPHSTYEGAKTALNYWINTEGLPKEKAVLGVPFYSHKNWVAYKDVIATYGAGAAYQDDAGGLDYNGIPTIKAKTELSLAEAGGIMFWEMSQDTQDETSLLTAISEVVGGDPDTSYPQWEGGHPYFVGDIVRYNGKHYIAVHDNPGYDPVISHWYWDEYAVVNPTYPDWQEGQFYAVGDIVTYEGQLYVAVHDNPGYHPTISHWYWDEYQGDGTGDDSGDPDQCSGSEWRQANLTNFESYPDPDSEECTEYNGCQWAGQFAGIDGVMPESWVASHNIAAVHSDYFSQYNGKKLHLRQGEKEIDVVVYDMCADSDCSGCCTENLGSEGFLIDIEKYTMQRFGTGSGSVEWQVCE